MFKDLELKYWLEDGPDDKTIRICRSWFDRRGYAHNVADIITAIGEYMWEHELPFKQIIHNYAEFMTNDEYDAYTITFDDVADAVAFKIMAS